VITVKELLQLNELKDFKLIAGKKGLNNLVFNTGILEHESESKQKISSTFIKGEFILTTLFFGKDDLDFAEECLIQLINQAVSAIAIKSIYFQDFSDQFKEYANLRSVPIFLFEDVYFDDIIVAIKNAIERKKLSDFHGKIVDSISKEDGNEAVVLRMAKEINHSFFKNTICAYCYKQEAAPKEIVDTTLKKLDFRARDNAEIEEHAIYSAFKYRKGILVIYTTDNIIPSGHNLVKFLDSLGINDKQFLIGVSDPHLKLEELGICIKKSIYAYITCQLENKTVLQFSQTGIDQVILPLRNNYWLKNYYSELSNRILQHDEKHGSKLMETAIEYIRSNYDIQLTAKKTFQHGNTIRYRLDKLKKILSLEENSSSFNEQLFMVIRLYLVQNIFPDI